MEFYASTASLFLAFSFCFNSQRDGILRGCGIRRGTRRQFQFPTGWNSTQTPPWIRAGWKSFNSQRDGILPWQCRWKNTRSRVSIPNGMEFYQNERIKNMEVKKFQFPTGWNSTHRLSMLYFFLRSFNSQRDGILHAPFRVEKSAFLRFNSQRDGILPKPRAGAGLGGAFQFPTGWNSTQVRRH